MMIGGKTLTIISSVATLGGVVCNLTENYTSKKQQEEMIRKMVSKEVRRALANNHKD